MKKSILLSINPKYCELIASGKKTIEIRKTKPKINTPFKCYIYETKSDGGRGKVIGEFVCYGIIPISIKYSDPNSRIALEEFPYSCLTDKQIIDYLGNGKQGYGWHISDLVIYDKPRKLSDFQKHCNHYEDCCSCKRFDNKNYSCICGISRPPQSWCYVESEEL